MRRFPWNCPRHHPASQSPPDLQAVGVNLAALGQAVKATAMQASMAQLSWYLSYIAQKYGGTTGMVNSFTEQFSAEGTELAIGSLTGVRYWTLSSPWHTTDGEPVVVLRGAREGWRPGENHASCLNAHAVRVPLPASYVSYTGYIDGSGPHWEPIEIAPYNVRPHDFTEIPARDCGCVAPGARVLTADLHWVPAGELAVGEHLLAFDEGSRGASAGRKYRDAVIACTDRATLPCYDLRFSDGTTVRVSSDHRWLVYTGQKAAHWVRTDELRAGDRRASWVVKPFDPWEAGYSREAGYLAAAFDGEGSLCQWGETYQNSVTFTQADNPMLAETERCLKELGFSHGRHVSSRGRLRPRRDGSPRLDMYRLSIGTRPELLHFLGSVRPARLLPKLQPHLLGRLNMEQSVRLVGKAFAGEQEVVKLGTTSGTYFAEGLASHNCGFWAYWEPPPASVAGVQYPDVVGVIEGWGGYRQGSKGFRCSRARLLGLCVLEYGRGEGWRVGAEAVLEHIYGVPVYSTIETLLKAHPTSRAGRVTSPPQPKAPWVPRYQASQGVSPLCMTCHRRAADTVTITVTSGGPVFHCCGCPPQQYRCGCTLCSLTSGQAPPLTPIDVLGILDGKKYPPA